VLCEVTAVVTTTYLSLNAVLLLQQVVLAGWLIVRGFWASPADAL
jgi:hypothetical protein